MAAPPDPIEQLKSESHHIIKNHDTTDSSLPVHKITTIKLSIQKYGANIIINKKAQPRLTLLRRTTIMVVLRAHQCKSWFRTRRQNPCHIIHNLLFIYYVYSPNF